MKTPITELIDQLEDHLKNDDDLDSLSAKDCLIKVIELAKTKLNIESIHIADAFTAGYSNGNLDTCRSGNQYFIATFNEKHSISKNEIGDVKDIL